MQNNPFDIVIPCEEEDVERPTDLLYKEAVKISGPFTSHWNENELYASYHWPQFDYPKAFRNTAQRCAIWRFGEFKNKTILDFGSNLGGMALELARRGANVTGLEYCQDRVDFTNKLAGFLQADAKFYQADLSSDFSPEVNELLDQEYDITTCFSVDSYLDEHPDDKPRLFDLLAKTTRRVCFFEANDTKVSTEDYKQMFLKHGFANVKFVNYSEKGTSPKPRRLFVAGKTEDMRTGAETKRLPDGRYCKQYYCIDEFMNQQKIFRHLWNVAVIPKVEFTEDAKIIYPDLGSVRLSDIKDTLTSTEKAEYKRQMIHLLMCLWSKGVAHRDLHPDNLMIHDGGLVPIDWDWATFQEAEKFSDLYDISLKGCLPIVWWPWVMDIVPISIFEKPRTWDDTGTWHFYDSTAEVLGITPQDLDFG